MTPEEIKQLTPPTYGGDWEMTCQEGEDEESAQSTTSGLSGIELHK